MEYKKEMYECPEVEELILALESTILSQIQNVENPDDTEDEVVI